MAEGSLHYWRAPRGVIKSENLNWDSQQGRDRATSGRNKKNSRANIMRKIWYNQIWIQKYLGFIVLILM